MAESVKHVNQIPVEKVSAGSHTYRQVLIGPDEGPNFAMRRFIMEPGGGIPAPRTPSSTSSTFSKAARGLALAITSTM